ncbi:ABC transporter ATP-binding protein [Paenibacillus sp. IB182496]|uniref:ABC transporter ATP-binding protein n=1 Tax=Paenibacillus sabuli TaxID=2772509 RepID=A0A927BR39_9BACL|nr:ABC transporter ATP-binding protein [Paenibacillus sabuli]MBD2845202.1 ABC transporter ATP-binding protein [Paenibacillus sabuli]
MQSEVEEGEEKMNCTSPFSLDNVTVQASRPTAELEGEEPSTLLTVEALQVQPGEWVQLIGPNGSGKTTLVRLLTGHLGTGLHVQGQLSRGFAGEEEIAYVMQHPDAALVGSTPREDILMGLELRGLPAARMPQLLELALASTGLEALADRPIEQLSGGQKQLTALAGCIAGGAQVLVLDEATSMLDAESARLVLYTVRELHGAGTAVVWVTHRQEEWARGDRLIALQKGRIAFDGAIDDFYGGTDGCGAQSVCGAMGLPVPEIVQVGLHLRARGYPLQVLPLTALELAEEVGPWR